jgi:beta-lactamase class A
VTKHVPVGSSRPLIQVALNTARDWAACDVAGGFMARNVDTGDELGFAQNRPFQLASVVKVPIALVVADLCEIGALQASQSLTLTPSERGPGPFGISAMDYEVTMAVGDLVRQMISVSDNAAADALLDHVGLDVVAATLDRWGVTDLAVRHDLRTMYGCAAQVAGDDFSLATRLAIAGPNADGSHSIESLDLHRANVGSAAACVELLQRIWTNQISTAAACATVRAAMRRQVFTHRLSADLRVDEIVVAGKTGTFLNLRHEIGVVEHGGTRVAVAALTSSNRAARLQADVDLAIGRAARTAFESLRTRPAGD